MPPAYNSAQKSAIAQFSSFTSTKESIAARFLKASGWNLENAIDAFFHNTNSSSPGSALVSNLSKIFDKYREDPKNNPDTIAVEGAMQYLADLKVDLEEVVMLSVFELVKSPTQGEITRDGFCEGWRDAHCDTIAKQLAFVANLRRKLPVDPDLFRRTYRYTFILARANPAQKALPLDIALPYWRILLTPDNGGFSWSTSSISWLDWWIEFMETKWKKGVNRDLWDQLGVFVLKTQEDEDMNWWSEDGAWPGAIDDFVLFVREKRGVTVEEVNSDEMEE